MPLSVRDTLLLILVIAVVTFTTRVIPFIMFPKGKEIPKVVLYLGKVLPPAVIGMLVIYCFRETDFLGSTHGIPEAAAVLSVILLHCWKRNNLLSIGSGTVIYMVLLRVLA